MTYAEPAARHAVLCISQLFEDFEYFKPATDKFAITHYNTAINMLVHGPPPSVDTVLLVCILFICIEFLRGNRAAAITHVTHGMQLLLGAGQRSRFASTYSQISVFPTFIFEEAVGSAFSQRAPGEGGECPVFSGTKEAQCVLDDLISKAVRVIRAGNPYRLENFRESPPQEIFDARAEVQQDMELWEKAFNKFTDTRSPSDREDSASLALRARHLLIYIWIQECLKADEMCFDDYKEEYLQILDWSRREADMREVRRNRPTRFTFETGWNTMLHFMVYKCRYLPLRIEGLSLMRRLSSERESLWDASLMCILTRRIIEVEHDIDLSGNYNVNVDALPPDSKRIRGFMFGENKEALTWDISSSKTIHFLMWSPESGCISQKESLSRYRQKLKSQQTVTRGCLAGQGSYLSV